MTEQRLVSKRNILGLLFLFVFASSLPAQPERKFAPFQRNNIFIETNFVPSDTGYTCFLSYKVSFDNLIFVKNGNKFSGGITLDFELIHKNKIIERKTSTRNIEVDSYDSTLSSTGYLQGVLNLNIGKKDYILNSFVTIANGDRNMHLDSLKIDSKEIEKHNILRPIAVVRDGTGCGKEFPFKLVNFENTIPFSSSGSDLLIPVTDTSVSMIEVAIMQEKKQVVKDTVAESIKANFGFVNCNDKIYFQRTVGDKTLKYFYVPDVNLRLGEGPAEITVTAGGMKPAEFKTMVLWNDKPKSLMSPELAIQCLAAIEKQETIDSLLNEDEEKYDKVLSEYWNNKFPGKNGGFNELEFEYYQRVDYALKKFGSVINKNGAKSDRGMIYIRYGKPDEIKRDYNNSNLAIEIWTYKRLNKEFLFTDKTGLGNYTLGQ